MEKGLSSRFEIKEVGEDGTFKGYASIFDTPDQGNDVVMRGAFKKTLEEWKAKGAPIPVCFSHDFKSVPIGGIDEAYEDQRGLWVEGKLGLEMALARDVHVALKNKWLRGLSFGFDAVQKKIENGKRYLKELKLYEVSHVLFGLHPEAQVLAVKADEDADAMDGAGPQGGLGAHIPDGDGSSPSPATIPGEAKADYIEAVKAIAEWQPGDVRGDGLPRNYGALVELVEKARGLDV